MNEAIEFKGKSTDEDMVEIKKSTIKMVGDSKCSIIIFVKDKKCHLFMEGDDKIFSTLIGESMAQSKEFRRMIVDAVKIYQEMSN